MNPFFSAIEQGYAPEEIIKYIAKSLPKLSQPIQRAANMGYNAQQIVSYLSKTMSGSKRDLRGKSESEIHELNRKENEKTSKNALAIGASALAVPAASTALSSALSRSLPESLKRLAPSLASQSPLPGAGNNPPPLVANPSSVSPPQQTLSTPQTGQQISSAQQSLISPSQQPPASSNASTVPQPQVNQQPEIKPLDLGPLKDKYKGFFNKIDDLKNSGNDTKSISAFFRKFSPAQSEKLEKETGSNLENIVENYIKSSQISTDQEKKSPESNILSQKVDENLQKEVQSPEQSKSIYKNDIVSTAHGIGNVKEIRNGQAIIDVDGKLHKVKEEELESSPLPEKELSDLYDDLIKGIESETGEDVSRMVQWAGYNPETNTLQFLPHTGKLYKYSNISEEDAKLLTDILSTRKSSGHNFIGAWKAGSKSPIGAALSKLIRKLQVERGGKGNEYEETHEPIYSAYEPAIQAKKKKKS